MTPQSASHLYKSVCLSKLTYGCEVMSLPDEAIECMEKYQSKLAKVFQGLPDQACNIGAVAGMGWLTVQSQIEIMTPLYFMRILPIECIYKRLIIYRFCYIMYETKRKSTGPLSIFIELCSKYQLIDIVQNVIEKRIAISRIDWKR